MNTRFAHIRKTLRGRPYRFLVYPLSFAYVLAVLLVYTYIYNGSPLEFYHTLPLWYTLITSILNIIISILFGIALTLFIAKIREVRVKSAGLGVMGLLFGGLAAGCPGCLFGLFPIVLSFFGVTGTLAILPLSGIEFQLVTLALMGMSVYFLAEETDVACNV